MPLVERVMVNMRAPDVEGVDGRRRKGHHGPLINLHQHNITIPILSLDLIRPSS